MDTYSACRDTIFLFVLGKGLTVTGRRGSHIFYTTGSQMAVRLSVGHPLTPGRCLIFISVRG
jgi:hypothetical protein